MIYIHYVFWNTQIKMESLMGTFPTCKQILSLMNMAREIISLINTIA